MDRHRRILRACTAVLAIVAGSALVAGPAGAQVDGTLDELVDDSSTTVTTAVEVVEDAVDGTVGEDGVVVDVPSGSVALDPPDLLADPVGSLGGLVTGEPAQEQPRPPAAGPTSAVAGESARSDTGGTATPPAGDEVTGERTRGAVPGVVTPRSPRPFVLTAREISTFGLPLVVAGLLFAYLGIDSWMRRREPVALPVTEDRDELLRFR